MRSNLPPPIPLGPTSGLSSRGSLTLPSVLRAFVITEIVLTVVWITEGFYPLFSEDLPEIPDGHAFVSDDYQTFGQLRLQALNIVSWTGLLQGWRSARMFYTTTWVMGLALDLISGPGSTSVFHSFIGAVSGLVGGIILALVYLSDLRRRHDAEINS